MVTYDLEHTSIVDLTNQLIMAAVKAKASDIHMDPVENGIKIRYRVDGDLQNFTYIPKAYERNLTTRLKLLANMNITESRLPQDGAIKGNFGGTYLDMRVSCLPLNEGEKIVIRILDYSRSLQGLDYLGFNESNLARLKRMIQVPNGIILITGATGSGKSTTVYSILQALNREETNIITVEDPIEMNIEGMNQVQVNSEIGMTFAAALRSILRQDPNVILIGEIRDSETAQIAVRAAITGHLVLSTIHTNNTLSTVERLLDMNVERYLLSTALTGIISQRLAKKICTKCRIERETSKFEKKVFKKYLKKDVDKIWDANHDGCDACRKGYKGRVAIQEVLELDDEMRNALNNENLSKDDLRNLVYSENVITMLQDALGKVVDGTTSFEEVLRVIEIEDAEDFFENDTANKLKESENEKEGKEEKKEEKEEQDKEEKNTTEQNKLEVVSLNNTPSKETQATLRTIPTITTEKQTPVKATSANKTINTLEKINAIEKQKQENTPSEVKPKEQPPQKEPSVTTTPIKQEQPIKQIIPTINDQSQPKKENTMEKKEETSKTSTPESKTENAIIPNITATVKKEVATPTPTQKKDNGITQNIVEKKEETSKTPTPEQKTGNAIIPNITTTVKKEEVTPTPQKKDNGITQNIVEKKEETSKTPTPEQKIGNAIIPNITATPIKKEVAPTPAIPPQSPNVVLPIIPQQKNENQKIPTEIAATLTTLGTE